LESLDKILREIQAFCGNETEIVLFSDHGMNLHENRRAHLHTHLRRNGFQVVGRFDKSARRMVAIPAFGLCGYAAIYCSAEEAIPEVAAALVELEGVDFSIYSDGGAVMVQGTNGRARIELKEQSGTKLYRYDDLAGDPLRLAPLAHRLRETGALDAEGFAPDKTWLESTATHIYPDVLANLHSSLNNVRVKHTADVLISFRDGYYFGWSPFGRLVRLAATHGNALRPSSTAFLMSTHRSLPQSVRADDAHVLLRG